LGIYRLKINLEELEKLRPKVEEKEI
jgi:hypothetical protein